EWTTAWPRSRVRVADSSSRVRCAKAVATMPAVGKAFAAGELSLEHVRVFARVVSDLEAVGQADAVEQALVDEARVVPLAHFARTVARLRDQAAADRGRDDLDRRRTGPSWLNVRRTVDGTVTVGGRFDREAGEVVLATVEKLASRSSDGDGRPAARRRADALATLCRAAAGRLMTASV